MNERDIKYEQDYSHSHCWEEKNPPCGQKIEHLECCICEKINPKALKSLDRAFETSKGQTVKASEECLGKDSNE